MQSKLKVRTIRRRLVAALAVAAVAAAAVTAAQLATADDLGSSRTDLKVMNWNIHGKTADTDAMAAKIKKHDINVLTVQESLRTDDVDHIEELAKKLGWFSGKLGDNAHFSQADRPGPCDAEEQGWAGNAVLSKYPIAKRVTIELSPQDQDCPVKRAMAGVKLNPPGSDYIHVFTSHFTPGRHDAAVQIRQAQAKKVLNYLDHNGPLLFTGDVNARPDDTIPGWFTDKGWKDTGAKAGNTHNGHRIDYIYAKDVKVTDSYVSKTDLSDHRPVITSMTV